MKRLNARGFGAVEAILVFVALGIVGGASFYVYTANKNTKESLNNTGNSEVVRTDKKTPGKESDKTPKKDYLVFKEWGIRITLNEKIQDAYYSSGSSPNSLSLRTKSLDIEPDCKNGPLSIAGIAKMPKDAVNAIEDKPYTESHAEFGKVIGDYFYYIQGAQYVCAQDPKNNELLSQVRSGFIEASKTIEAN